MDNEKRKRVTVVVRKKPCTGKSVVPQMVSAMRGESSHVIPSDVTGSYTGNPIDDEVPVQDADDL